MGVYAQILDPPVSVCDVTFWLNFLLLEKEREQQSTTGGSISCHPIHENKHRGKRYAAINTAVEATTLNERCFNLRPQDRFLRDNISSEDVLIVSICGTDIALCPTPSTIAAMAGLICLPMSCLEGAWSFGTAPVSVSFVGGKSGKYHASGVLFLSRERVDVAWRLSSVFLGQTQILIICTSPQPLPQFVVAGQ